MYKRTRVMARARGHDTSKNISPLRDNETRNLTGFTVCHPFVSMVDLYDKSAIVGADKLTIPSIHRE